VTPPSPPAPTGDQSVVWRARAYAAAITVLGDNGLPIDYANPENGIINTGWGPDIAQGELLRVTLDAQWKLMVTVAGGQNDVLVSINGVVKTKSLTGPGYDESAISNGTLSGTTREYDKMMSIKYDIERKAHE
jgi:hypothetical protein